MFALNGAAIGTLLLGAQESLVDVQGWTMIWTFVWFVVLLAVLGRFAWKPLVSALESREQGIRDSIDEANRAREEAQALLADHKKKLEDADQEVKRMLEEGRQQAATVKEQIIEEARSQAKSTVERATREIDLARDEALQSIRQEAVDLSVALASKVIRKSLSPKDHEELIRESMKELEL